MIKKHSINGDIEAKVVNLVDGHGTMIGEMPIEKARTMAREADLDLVEVSPSNNGQAPICKILDYGKMQYQTKKKNHEHKNHSTKEVRVSFQISPHDLDRKREQASKFLSDQHKTIYTMQLQKGKFRGTTDDALDRFKQQIEYFEGRAKWDKLNVSNRSISVLLHPA